MPGRSDSENANPDAAKRQGKTFLVLKQKTTKGHMRLSVAWYQGSVERGTGNQNAKESGHSPQGRSPGWPPAKNYS